MADNDFANEPLTPGAAGDKFPVIRGPDGTPAAWTDELASSINEASIDVDPSGHSVLLGSSLSTVLDQADAAIGGKVTGPSSATDNAIARFDGATGKLIQNSGITIDDSGVLTVTNAATPTAPASGSMALYSAALVGRSIPAWVDSKFEETYAQPAFFDGRYRFLWTPVQEAIIGDTIAASGTAALAGPGSPWTGPSGFVLRNNYSNIATTTNQVVGFGGSNLTYYRSSTAGSRGGLLHFSLWGYDTWTNGGRHFNGYSSSSTTVASADPSGTNNTMGFAVDAADNGAISFLTRSTSATKASTGLTISSGKGYKTWFYAPHNDSNIYWKITDINTGTTATGTATATLPAVDTRLVIAMRTSNAALTAATAVRLGIACVYGESAR